MIGAHTYFTLVFA